MRQFSIMIVVALATLASLAAAPSTTGGFTPVATEPCVAGPDADGLASPDWQDLCEVAFADAQDADDVVQLSVRLTAVGDVEDRPVQMVYLTRWRAGSCQLELFHRDGTEDRAADDLLRATCDIVEGQCEPVGPINSCERDTAGFELEVPTAPPVIAGDTVTWTVAFDGELAALAGVHAPGAVLTPTRTVAGAGPAGSVAGVSYWHGPGAGGVTCIRDNCHGGTFEVVDADRTYTIG